MRHHQLEYVLHGSECVRSHLAVLDLGHERLYVERVLHGPVGIRRSTTHLGDQRSADVHLVVRARTEDAHALFALVLEGDPTIEVEQFRLVRRRLVRPLTPIAPRNSSAPPPRPYPR